MNERRPMWKRLSGLLPWAAFGYLLWLTGVITEWNILLGHPLPEDYNQGKWRGEHEDFAAFLFFVGIWAYPLALFLIFHFSRLIWSERKLKNKLVSVAVVATCCMVFYCLLRLGVGPDVGEGGR